MKVKALYKNILEEFKNAGIEAFDFEARLLICEAFGFSLTDFFLNGDCEVTEAKLNAVSDMSQRRIKGEPLQYIIGSWDFMGRSFKVGQGVLIPRPETELLCERIIERIKCKKNPVVYDLCSGSGCIAVTLKAECPEIEIYAVEKSEAAIEYLSINSKNLSAAVNIIKGDVLDVGSFAALPDADIIVSNPPYIKSGEIPFLQKEVGFEPLMALDGGTDGLDFYRYIIYKWSQKLNADGEIFFEIGEEQGNDVSLLFKDIGFDSRITKDYNNHDRIVEGRKSFYVV